MLPAIQRHARIAFRRLDAEARAEMIEEVVANAFVAYTRLVELDKADLAYATPLASYGIKQAKAGRRVAEVLATGESTKKVARRFRVSPGRVSQIRRELKRCWDAFQGQSREAPAVA